MSDPIRLNVEDLQVDSYEPEAAVAPILTGGGFCCTGCDSGCGINPTAGGCQSGGGDTGAGVCW